MPIQLYEENGGKLLAVHVSGKLTASDYEHFVPEFERLVGLHGKLRVLFNMAGLHGWTAGALWEDTKFAMHHFSDIDRVAVVGEKKWQECLATFCKPFTKATVKYFDHNDGRQLCYSAGVMVLSKEHPRTIRYRSVEPVLTPMLPQERNGTIANVVFPTGIDRRDDLGKPNRFDVYYGMADNRIGVARLDLPEHLPPGAAADLPEAAGNSPVLENSRP